MIVMVANNDGREAKRLRDEFPARLGHLYSPGTWRRTPWQIRALDNGAFKGFEPEAFRKHIAQAAPAGVRWCAVPDVPYHRGKTLAMWREWSPIVAALGLPLAFVAQDGMGPGDVPGNATVVFIGGSTEWKWDTLKMWCGAFPRVHVGRVNTERLLWQAHRAGAESVDGTGFFRGDRKQLDGLWYYLADSEGLADAAHGPMQPRLFA